MRISLPQVEGKPGTGGSRLKRLMLPQGELAHFWDGPEPIQYLAFLELRPNTVRGNHYHLHKREFLYLISGEIVLCLGDIEQPAKFEIQVRAGDLVDIRPGIAHAYRVVVAGEAIEFSDTRFDAADMRPFVLT